MLSIYQKNQLASFGFLGAHIVNKGSSIESKSNTKRYRVYQKAIVRLFGEATFTHHQDKQHSTYLMVNNRHKDVDTIREKAKSMFDDLFPELGEA